MAISQSNVPTLTSRIANPDIRTLVNEKLTLVDVTSRYELTTESDDSGELLVVTGPDTPTIVAELVQDDNVPLGLSAEYIDGATGQKVTELKVVA